jgi:two-component system sensor histidine kinase DegS
VLEIVDNGVGFDKNQKVRPDAYGLIGMKERIKLIDGIIVVASKKGEGTSVRVEIPYEYPS